MATFWATFGKIGQLLEKSGNFWKNRATFISTSSRRVNDSHCHYRDRRLYLGIVIILLEIDRNNDGYQLQLTLPYL